MKNKEIQIWTYKTEDKRLLYQALGIRLQNLLK